MKLLALFLLAGFVGPYGDPDPDEELKSLVETITEEDCRSYLEFLAGPSCYGRSTPSLGLDRAAEFVEQHLEAWGLEAAGPEGSYRLPYELPCGVAGEGAHFNFSVPGESRQQFKLTTDFLPVPGSKPGGVGGVPVFVGYAIDAKNERWRDLSSKNCKNKIVFAFTREPRADDPKNKKFEGLEFTRYASVVEKARAVEQAGGLGLVLVPDPSGFPDVDGPPPGMLPMYIGRRGDLSRFTVFGDLPVMSCSRAVAEKIFGVDLTEYQAEIDKKYKPKTLEAPDGARIEMAVRWDRKEVPVYNLAARIPGTDGSGEVVVLGAHLDHVGFQGSTSQGRFEVHPGADDNASGSTALLEVAQAFAGTKPKKTILFLWFTGEEIGLLGSRAYCREPIYPHDRTIVMMNMDMVGRCGAKEAVVAGLWDAPKWQKLIKGQARKIRSKLKLDFKFGRHVYTRSDHYAFHESGVFDMFFFEGNFEKGNKVYHKSGDVPATMDMAKIARVAQLVAASAYAVAHEGVMP